MIDPIVSNVLASDGCRLLMREWVARSAGPKRGVLMIHGLGEHSGRYAALANWFCARGWRVRTYDHRGHGQSSGARGAITPSNNLTDDAESVLNSFNGVLDQPALVLGHSMGGLIAAHLATRNRVALRGLILSSPALDIGLSALQRLQLNLMHRMLPQLPLPNGLKIDYLCRSRDVVQAYRTDPLVHGKVTAKLVQYLVQSAAEVQTQAAGWPTPTLLLAAGKDRLVAPRGSRRFAGAAPLDTLTFRWYDNAYHELFNEPDSARVLADCADWLDRLAEARPLRTGTGSSPTTSTEQETEKENGALQRPV